MPLLLRSPSQMSQPLPYRDGTARKALAWLGLSYKHFDSLLSSMKHAENSGVLVSPESLAAKINSARPSQWVL